MSQYWVAGQPGLVVAKSTDDTGLYRFWAVGRVVVFVFRAVASSLYPRIIMY